MSLPTNNLQGALLHFKNYSMEKVLILYRSKNIIITSVVHLLITVLSVEEFACVE